MRYTEYPWTIVEYDRTTPSGPGSSSVYIAGTLYDQLNQTAVPRIQEAIISFPFMRSLKKVAMIEYIARTLLGRGRRHRMRLEIV